jgi:dolichol-phosphate mannosyltransferase
LTTASQKIVLALPAYNEADSIDPLFERIADARARALPNLSVLLYNDGSKDNTQALAAAWHGRKGLPVRVIGMAENRGLGWAVASLIRDFGSAEAGGQPGAPYMALMDCDDTMDPFQITAMLEKLEAEKLDLVIASRYRSGATVWGVPFHRRVMSRGARVLFGLMHPIRGVRDYSCGFRLYRRDLLERALAEWGDDLIVQRGFASMVEVLLKLGRMGAKCGEIPLQLHYDQKRGESKMPVGDNATRLLKLMWKWRKEGLVPPGKTNAASSAQAPR